MRSKILLWAKANWEILFNSTSIVGSTAIGSILGFIFWWFAARVFSPDAVGTGSAMVSSMSLLGIFAVMGFDTFLIGELPRYNGDKATLIGISLLLPGITASIISFLFCLIAPITSHEFAIFFANIFYKLLFISGVTFTTISIVLDQVFIGLLKGGFQLIRNSLFAAFKLVLLFVVGFQKGGPLGILIFATWVIGNLFSLVVTFFLFPQKSTPKIKIVEPNVIVSLWKKAFGHYLLNITLLAPNLLIPIIVTIMLSSQENGYFYVAWLIAGFTYMVPTAFTTVLFAIGSSNTANIQYKMKQTLLLSIIAGLITSGLLLFFSHSVLSVFGKQYAENVSFSLQILGMAIFPLIIKAHFIAISRIYQVLGRAIKICIFGCILEIFLAIVGAKIGRTTLLCITWSSALFIEMIIMAPTVIRALSRSMWRASSLSSDI